MVIFSYQKNVRLEGIEPSCLFRIIQLRGAAVFFAERVIDIPKRLLKHNYLYAEIPLRKLDY